MRPLRNLLMSSVALSSVVAGPAIAQSASTSDREMLTEVVVTARRIEERLQDVPISITAYSQEQLTRRNIVNATDLTLYTPSLSANTVFGDQNTGFALRGFSQDTGTQPAVGVYFADVVAPRGGAISLQSGDGAGPGSFFDLQNVQVLKGPQGTLFGRNTTGGAILIVPQRPTDEFEGYLEGTVGNYDRIGLQGVLNVPISEAVRMRVGFDRQKRDGYLINTTGVGAKRFNDSDYFAVRASLVVDITPDLENYLVASYANSDIVGYLGKTITGDPLAPTGFVSALVNAELARPEVRGAGFYSVQSAITDPFNHLRQWQLVNKTSWTANANLTIRNIISYAELKQRMSTEVFGTFLDPSPLTQGAVRPRTVPLNVANLRSLPNGAHAHQSTFTEEFRLEGQSFQQRLDWQAGAYVELSKPTGVVGSRTSSLLNCPDLDNLLCINPLSAGSVTQTIGGQDFHSYGVYAQGSFHVTRQFSLTGGIRHTWDKVEASLSQKRFRYPVSLSAPTAPSSISCINPRASLPDCVVDLQQKSDKSTWLIGAEFKPNEDLLLYAKYARGYRAGGVAPGAPVAFQTFNPEKVDAYEIGLKATFRAPVPGTFNIAAIYNDFSNQQLLAGFQAKVLGLTSVIGIVNAGKSRIKGFEVETSLNPFNNFRFDLGYSYLDTEILQVEPVPDIDALYRPGSAPAVGNPLALTPKHQLTMTGSYTLPLNESIGEVTLSATYNYTSRTLSGYSGSIVILKPKTLLNATLEWKSIAGSHVDGQLFVTNLTKEKYSTYRTYSAGVNVFDTIGQPRMYGARIRYGF
jgi:iron complex outermembrane receptor protein